MAWWSVCSAMFYLVVSATLALAYGSVNAIIGLVLSVIAYAAVNAVLVRHAIRTDATRVCVHSSVDSGQRPEMRMPFSVPSCWNGVRPIGIDCIMSSSDPGTTSGDPRTGDRRPTLVRRPSTGGEASTTRITVL